MDRDDEEESRQIWLAFLVAQQQGRRLTHWSRGRGQSLRSAVRPVAPVRPVYDNQNVVNWLRNPAAPATPRYVTPPNLFTSSESSSESPSDIDNIDNRPRLPGGRGPSMVGLAPPENYSSSSSSIVLSDSQGGSQVDSLQPLDTPTTRPNTDRGSPIISWPSVSSTEWSP